MPFMICHSPKQKDIWLFITKGEKNASLLKKNNYDY